MSVRLRDLDVLVVDCQTTGATPALGHVLEIGWAVTRPAGGDVVAEGRRVELPEGARVPRVIAELTGFSRHDRKDAIAPEEAWKLVRDAARGTERGGLAGDEPVTPTVIHFARFELVFLRDLHARFGQNERFGLDVVCAHDIARRLFPDLPRRGLRALAGYFGHGLELERHASSHTRATALVWRHLVERLEAEGVEDWAGLRSWLESPAPPPSRRRAYPLPRQKRLALPAAPGVYRMLRSSGEILYVGKAASLKHRVSSHFTQGRTSERALEMLTQVHDLDVTETPSILEAALLENDEIKRHDPPYNVQLRERSAWFAPPAFEPAVEGLDETSGGRALGPFPSRYALWSLAAVRALAEQGVATRALSARALGVPLAFAPDETTFALGWAAFVERYVAPARSRTTWGRFMKASKVLQKLLGEGALEEGSGEGGWDQDRIRRHLERAVLQGGQLIRRARWLCLLSDASVAFREGRFGRRRLLVLRGAEVVEARDLELDEPLPLGESPRSWRARQASFDGARYDRLRVLTTELKRVLAGEGSEEGEVSVRIGSRLLLAPAVSKLLRSV